MRMLVLAGGVTVAVVVAVVVIGLRLARDDDPNWSARATEICERGLSRARDALDAGDAIGPDEKRALDVYAGATEIESEVIAELEELPRPTADEQAIAAALAVVNDSHQDDVAAVRSLRRRFDRTLFERRVNATVPVLADLRSRFGRLGAAGCVSYYDPDAYR